MMCEIGNVNIKFHTDFHICLTSAIKLALAVEFWENNIFRFRGIYANAFCLLSMHLK